MVRQQDRWADHMEFTDGLDKYQPGSSDRASQPLQGLDACHEHDDLLVIGLDMHALMEDKEKESLSDQ